MILLQFLYDMKTLEELGIPSYTVSAWRKLSPRRKFEEMLIILDQGMRLDTVIERQEREYQEMRLDQRLPESYLQDPAATYADLFELLTRFHKKGIKAFESTIPQVFLSVSCPYDTNNFIAHLPPSGLYYDRRPRRELTRAVLRYVKERGFVWQEPLGKDGKPESRWEEFRQSYPLYIEMKREGYTKLGV